MKHLFTLRILFLCIFAALGMRVSAEIIEYQDGDLMYELNTETLAAEIYDCNRSATEVIIPESVTDINGVTYRVTSLGGWCFAYCYSLSSISIPSSVTSLGQSCFFNCI